MNFKLVRSKRKSVSISVLPDNSVIVRCPYHMSESRIREFVESKRSWIEKVVGSNSQCSLLNSKILEYKEVYICGNRLPIMYSNKNYICNNTVYIKNKECIRKLFINNFSEYLCNLALSISKELTLSAADYKVKAYKSRWGCCKRDGTITLNYLLAMLPIELQRYVIIHELCHIVYFNHSKEFWEMVGRFEPQYRIRRNELKSFNFITNLY